MSEQNLESKKAIVFSREGCGPCASVKAMLKNHGYTVIDKLYVDNVAEFKYWFPDVKSVPQVVIDNKAIGSLMHVMIYLAGTNIK